MSVVGADDLDVEIGAPEQTRRVGDFGHCDDEVGERLEALRFTAHQHAGQHAVPEAGGVDEGQDAKGPRVLDAAYTGANGSLRDADGARDRAKRSSPVLLQLSQDRAIGVVELGLHLRAMLALWTTTHGFSRLIFYAMRSRFPLKYLDA